MATLEIPLAGPMQSWVTSPATNIRMTQRHPTRSGVLGLLGAALGRPRGDLGSLHSLELFVRIDKPGVFMDDYQTVQNVYTTTKKNKSLVTHRWHLADAVFTVAAGGDTELLRDIHNALRRPVFPTYLGRNSCPPAVPMWKPDGLHPDQTPSEILGNEKPVVRLEDLE